ncbi:hypothetical protein [Burkholderia stagnalis]|uniref:hypothetical protein n=1 Tax=Burkholderia stagnalis TaxID=1503054 RepID=UPI000F589678|nr:hypothetical protein [Burkholderia stagnalis]RQQ36005.1 hypothetical protein DF163_05090 [Burkholderia stagnalis]RQQ39663.1 hypothetical protein DF149_01890 [Burkholderia stagnalis]RQQ54555.1 hypothetical protein DF162_02190 [Burkholderia stagnalis]RQY04124.1 hypothetical protein DF119_00095 [Burkholderia stagnalis]RQY17455.1 hypothetical protein DF118_05380 [Burkholderia stagnalis]
MKRLGSIAVLTVLAATCSPTAFCASQDTVPPMATEARNCVPPAAAGARRPLSIRVCVSDPDTQLTLPWFLTDIINAVNTRQSGGELLHQMRKDF